MKKKRDRGIRFSKRSTAYQPVMKYGIPECEPWETEYQEFWRTQIKRCIEGYRPYGSMHSKIPGRYYFYLNFCKVKTLYDHRDGTVMSRKRWDFPYYRDIDHEFFHMVEEAQRQKKGLIVLKARRKGITMNTIGGICIYESTVPYGNEIGIGTYSEDQIRDYKNKFDDMYSHIHPFFRQTRILDNNDVIKMGARKGKDIEGSLNTIYFKHFYNNTGAYRGHSLKFLLFEEAGENPLLLRAFLASEECFKEGDVYFGTPIIFGTSNQINNGIRDFEEMYYNAEKYNLLSMFIPASKAYYPFINLKTGKSEEDDAIKAINKERKKRYSMEDKTSYYTYLQEMPLKPQDAFLAGMSAYFNRDKIDKQIEYVMDNVKGKIRRGRLEWMNSPHGNQVLEVEWKDDPNGQMLMLYEPITDEKGITNPTGSDVAGLDPYTKDESVTSDSKGCLIVYRSTANMGIPDEMPVFLYHDRPKTKELFYEECLKILLYYNAKVLIEDTDDEIFKWFITNGFTRLLKESPQVYHTLYTKASNKYGYNIRGAGRKAKLIDNIHDYVENSCHNILFLDLLKELRIFGSVNTDKVMAFGLALIHAYDNAWNTLRNITRKTKETMSLPVYKRTADGTIIMHRR